jgi:hypothetical protein
VRGRAAAVLGVVVVLTMLLATSATGQVVSPSDPVIQAGPADPTNSQNATFTFEDQGPDVTFACRLDGAPEEFEPCDGTGANTAHYTSVLEGPHLFEVKAVDLPNSESGVASYPWTIDLQAPPPPTITSGPEEVVNSTTATFTLDDSEVGVSYLCTLDGLPQACPAFSGLSEGLHTLSVVAKDAAGNESFPSAPYTWTVDLSSPHPAITSPAAGGATADQTPPLLGTADTGPADEDTVTVTLYAGSSTAGSPLQTLSQVEVAAGSWSTSPTGNLPVGEYTVKVSQSDSFGRTGTSGPVTFRVDLTAPTVSLTRPRNGVLTGNPLPTYRGFAGTNVGDLAEVTVEVYQGSTASGLPLYSIPAAVAGDGTWSAPQPTPLTDGKYAALAKQSDDADSVGTSPVHVFTLDTIPPSAITNVTVRAGYSAVAIGWRRGSNWKATDALRIYRRVAGSAVDTRSLRVTTTASSWTDRRVQNGVTYQYDLVPIDAAKNLGSELNRKARPTGFRTPRNGATLTAPIGISWVDVPRSDYSNIQVWNAGLSRKMLSVWPRDNGYTLRSRWRYQGRDYRLRRGSTYRIYGWPGFGSVTNANYGKSYGWVQFTVR